MSKRKRQRNTTPNDYNDEQARKLQRVSFCSDVTIITDRYSVNQFEDMSNGIFHEVFGYLDAYHIYNSFFNLNTRFQKLFTCSTIPIYIKISTLSKSAFENYYTDFIKPNKHRIQSLHLSDPFTIDFFSSVTEDISQCSQLQSLLLHKIESQCLEHLLNRLPSLTNLSSLAIHVNQNSNKIKIYNLIFQLPVLKYCKISFEDNIRLGLLPMSTNTLSPIEDLVIVGVCNLNEINAFLSYVLQLRRLSVNYINGIYEGKIENCSFVLNHLTFVTLKLDNVDFLSFEQFAEYHFRHVQVLYISTNFDSTYIDDGIWEQLILSSIPHLRIFDLQVVRWPFGDTEHALVINQFNSLFWLQRQWSFTCEISSRDDGYSYRMFYSTRPYRRKYFTLSSNSFPDKTRYHEKTVHHVIIQDEKMIDNCSKYFPNVNQLTLSNNCSLRSEWFTTNNIDRLIPLAQLTKLTIDIPRYYFVDLIAMLRYTPNIHTLVLQCKTSTTNDSWSLERTETFRLVTTQNKIKHVTILHDYSLKKIKVLFNLCPQLEHLTIGTSRQSLEATIRFLLSEDNKRTCHLSSLCIVEVDTAWIEKLKTLIEPKNCLDEYSIKIIDRNFYLWW